MGWAKSSINCYRQLFLKLERRLLVSGCEFANGDVGARCYARLLHGGAEHVRHRRGGRGFRGQNLQVPTDAAENKPEPLAGQLMQPPADLP